MSSSLKRSNVVPFAVMMFILSTVMSTFPVYIEAKDGPTLPGSEVTRSSQYYNSPTGGKWVYDLSEPDPLSVSKNLSFIGGYAHLEERFELDDLSTGTVGSLPPNWVESDPSEGDLVLDSGVYGNSPNSAHYTTVSGGQGYSVTRTMQAIGSSDTMEVRFSIRVDDVLETTSDQGLICRLHYTGQNDGAEMRFHSNGTISIYGWTGSGNDDIFFNTGFDMSTWYTITMDVNMSSQSVDLTVDDQLVKQGAPFRSASGSDILFMNSISFITGSGSDGAEFYLDDMYSTRNTIDSGKYTSPTISKTNMMEWQYLQVFPGENEDLLSLSLLDLSSGFPYTGYDGIPVPSNGRISVAQLPPSAQNFKVEVAFTRDVERRPTLDLVGASWKLSGHFFDPLFPGTGLDLEGLDHNREGMSLTMLSPGSYETTGKVITEPISLTPGRIWGRLEVDHTLLPGTAIAVDVIGPADEIPVAGMPTSHNGTVDLFNKGLPLDEVIRIKITLTGDGTVSPIIKWITLEEPLNTDPCFDDVEVGRGEMFRMENLTLSLFFDDDTDKWEDLEIRGEYKGPGSDTWMDDMISEPEYHGTYADMLFEPPADADIGDYELRGVVEDRSGIVVISDPVTVTVLNVKVSRPGIEITPFFPFTDNILRVTVIEDSIDREGEIVKYRYHWYVNGELVDPDDPYGKVPGWMPENLSSKETSLSPVFTSKGDNISCKVVATDLLEDGPPAWVYLEINNSVPKGPGIPIAIVMEEDTSVDIDLAGNFSDVDGDDLEFRWGAPEDAVIEDTGNGTIRITPRKDFNGELVFNVTASDGFSEVSTSISLTYTPVNDDPFIDPIDDRSMDQGDEISISIVWGDAESGQDSALEVDLPDTWGEEGSLTFDRPNSTILVKAENGNVGNHTFRITARDKEGNDISRSFNITVVNVNDPLVEAVVVSPADHSEFKVGEMVVFVGDAVDPDIIYGQEMIYKWFIITDEIGRGKEINYTFFEPGSYTITLEVSEGISSKLAKIIVNITEEGGGGGGGGGGIIEEEMDDLVLSPMLMGISGAAVLLLLIIVIFIIVSRKKGRDSAE
ncbi:MAG: Ig-like domain-containing protein, partial [Candidatus Thermoplasmatota archaeon]|nr:Ig-like domain-containing protein [Candidatus Thermoplasmatota archaeon]